MCTSEINFDRMFDFESVENTKVSAFEEFDKLLEIEEEINPLDLTFEEEPQMAETSPFSLLNPTYTQPNKTYLE